MNNDGSKLEPLPSVSRKMRQQECGDGPTQGRAGHSWASLPGPSQSDPLFRGGGAMQAWVLTCVPLPHVAEQSDHTDQGVQAPSTGTDTRVSNQVIDRWDQRRSGCGALTSALDVLAVASLGGAGAGGTDSRSVRDRGKAQPHVSISISHHCSHSPCSQVSPTLSSRLPWRQRGGQGPGSQGLCWTSSNWHSVPSASGIRDLKGRIHLQDSAEIVFPVDMRRLPHLYLVLWPRPQEALQGAHLDQELHTQEAWQL